MVMRDFGGFVLLRLFLILLRILASILQLTAVDHTAPQTTHVVLRMSVNTRECGHATFQTAHIQLPRSQYLLHAPDLTSNFASTNLDKIERKLPP